MGNVVSTVAKVLLLALGLLLLVGGGLCSLIMVAEVGKTGSGLDILVAALGVAAGGGWLSRVTWRRFRPPAAALDAGATPSGDADRSRSAVSEVRRDR